MRQRILITLLFTTLLVFSCRKEQPVIIEPIVENNIQPLVSDIDTTANIASENSISKQIEIPKPKALALWDLRAKMSRAEFETKKGAELEMLLIHPIYSKIYDLDEDDSSVIPHLTEGQKALYFFRKMDEVMSEGGIESLYESDMTEHLSIAANAFNKIENKKLGVMAEKAAIDHKRLNSIPNPNRKIEIDPFMKGFDNEYSKNHNEFYTILEKYILEHPEEFIDFEE